VHFGWVKGHMVIEGNVLLDRLAKEAAEEEGPVVYNKIPRDVIVTSEKDMGLHMWEQQRMDTGKGAVTKDFFSSVKNRLQQKSNIPRLNNNTNNTWENKYLYRLGIIDNPMCACEEEEQIVEHLIFKCKELSNKRDEKIQQIKSLVKIGRQRMKHLQKII